MNLEIDRIEEYSASGKKLSLPRIFLKKNVCPECQFEMFYQSFKCPACEAKL
jgi:hypothetical protein